MSKPDTQISTVFDMQRNAVLQSQRIADRMIDLQTEAADSMLDAMKTGIDATEESADVTKAAVDAYFDAVEASTPGDAEGVAELRATVHEQVDAGNEIRTETLEAVAELTEENVAAAGEFVEDYADVVDDSFDAFLETHERVEEQAVSAAEDVEIPLDDE